jgi:hypothetical protein
MNRADFPFEPRRLRHGGLGEPLVELRHLVGGAALEPVHLASKLNLLLIRATQPRLEHRMPILGLVLGLGELRLEQAALCLQHRMAARELRSRLILEFPLAGLNLFDLLARLHLHLVDAVFERLGDLTDLLMLTGGAIIELGPDAGLELLMLLLHRRQLFLGGRLPGEFQQSRRRPVRLFPRLGESVGPLHLPCLQFPGQSADLVLDVTLHRADVLSAGCLPLKAFKPAGQVVGLLTQTIRQPVETLLLFRKGGPEGFQIRTLATVQALQFLARRGPAAKLLET